MGQLLVLSWREEKSLLAAFWFRQIAEGYFSTWEPVYRGLPAGTPGT